jgi:hypothetical protein
VVQGGIFNAQRHLHNKETGDYDAMLLTIDHAIEEFKSAFALETALVKYFETTWEKKKGVSKSKNTDNIVYKQPMISSVTHHPVCQA